VDAPLQKAVVHHALRGKFGYGSSSLVVGGLHKRAPQHQWDGEIEALRIANGQLSEVELGQDPSLWANALALWRATAGPGQSWVWNGDGKANESADPRRQAMNDLCQVLLNCNEFLYLQ